MNHRLSTEISEHDQLVLMMAKYFQSLGYTEIKADLPGWTRPNPIWWTKAENRKFIPDLTCKDSQGKTIILEAETCSSFNQQHTHDQFQIFRAHASNLKGRFEVVVPKYCAEKEGRQLIQQLAREWGFQLDNIWTPS